VGLDIAVLGIGSVIPGAENPVDDAAAPRPAESKHHA